MPTRDELIWLVDNCTWTWDSSKKGSIVTSKQTGNSIFLPAAGRRYDSSLYDAGSLGLYWSSSLYATDSSDAYYLYFNSSSQSTGDYGYRCYGRSVRAVCVLSE